MADNKHLAGAGWRAFARGRTFKDVALLKAYAEFEKADAPALRLDALDELEKQAGVLRTANKADKDVGRWFDEFDKAAGAERKSLKQARAEQEAEADEPPTALSTGLVPLLRAVRGGETLPALVAVAPRVMAAILTRRGIGAAQRKLLLAHLGADQKPRFVAGTCCFEANAYTFVVEGAAAGLAKRLAAALLAQTGQRLKVRVRGEDPNDVDDDGEVGDDGESVSGELSGAASGAASQMPGTPDDAVRAQWQQRLAEVEPRLLAALKAQHPAAGKLRAVIEFAHGKTGAGDHAAALKALATLAQLLDAGDAPPPGVAEALAHWRQVRDGVVGQLKAMAREVAASRDVESQAAIVEIGAVVRQLTADPARPEQAAELARWLGQDDVVADVYELAEDVRTPLETALQGLQRAFATVAPR